MSISRISAERFASLFHHYHEALAPDFNCASESQAPSWSEVPDNERSRTIAAIRLVLLDLGYSGGAPADEGKSYFARPGEAEWGC